MFDRGNATSFLKTLPAFEEMGKMDNRKQKSYNITNLQRLEYLMEGASEIPEQKAMLSQTDDGCATAESMRGRRPTVSFYQLKLSFFFFFEQ